MRKFLLAVAVALIAASPVRADLMDLFGDPFAREAETVSASGLDEYRSRADDGDARAMLILAILHEQGRLVAQNWRLSHRNANIAATLAGRNGDTEVAEAAAAHRDRLATRLSASDVAAAQKDATEWLGWHEREVKARAAVDSGKKWLGEVGSKGRELLRDLPDLTE